MFNEIKQEFTKHEKETRRLYDRIICLTYSILRKQQQQQMGQLQKRPFRST